MRNWAVLTLAAILAACTTVPVTAPANLFEDGLFKAATEPVRAGEVFALSEEMRHYLHVEIRDQLHIKGPRLGLIDALYTKSQLRLDYDAAKTRNAAQTFNEHAGNCLSLAIMTAALADELGVPVQFRRVAVEETWTRQGDLYFAIGHINLVLGREPTRGLTRYDDNPQMTIDFIPLGEAQGLHSMEISRETVIAMFMNNRAAEALARGKVDNAYWWAREAVRQDPTFLSSYNTLGVVYRHHGNLPEAERVLRHALRADPDNLHTLSNLAIVLNSLGQTAEAQTLTARLERRQPFPPYHFFHLGQAAMQARDFRAARDLFSREVVRDPYNAEFQYSLASAYAGLGEVASSRRHLKAAMEFSSTVIEHQLYAAKLVRLKAAYN